MASVTPAADAGLGTSVRIYLPDERLRSFVTFYYFVESDTPLEDFLYPEWGNVRFPVRGSWLVQLPYTDWETPLTGALFGPTDRATRVASPGGKTVGFGLTPLGWQRFLQMPADSLANRVADLDDAFGMAADHINALLRAQSGDAEGVALFDTLLLARLGSSRPNSKRALLADQALRERPHDVDAFAAAANLPARTLVRFCHQLFGFSPKRLLRRQRFLDTLGLIRVTEQPQFSDLIDEDYFDQAHFNREFREFMGLTPSQYLAVPRPIFANAARAQAAAGIPLSFKLPPQPEI
jgi:AraC-like DNA-binding protein